MSKLKAIRSVVRALAATVLFAWLPPAAAAQTNLPSRLTAEADFAAYAKTNFLAAQQKYRPDSNQVEAAWQFARACFDLGEFATNSSERAQLAEQGIAAARRLLTYQPKLCPAHHYLGMNLGQLARTKSLGALKLVDEMEREFLVARGLDEQFDHAGPDRNLGLLYRDAPALGSVGSRSKARRHLLRAAVVAPDYPDNRLNLVESFLKWGDRASARREFKELEELWPRARAALTGDPWAASWADWEKRLSAVRQKIEEQSKLLETPRQKD
jgi:hypothetical protein